MGLFNSIGDIFSSVGNALIDAVRWVASGVWTIVAGIIGCIVGELVYGFEYLFTLIVNPGDRQDLSDRMKRILGPYFTDLDLNDVELRTGATLAIPSARKALTLGHTIFFRGQCRECNEYEMQVLMHELVHVRQYDKCLLGGVCFACKYGAGTAVSASYSNNPLEKEAVDFVDTNSGTLLTSLRNECANVVRHGERRSVSNWFWLVWS